MAERVCGTPADALCKEDVLCERRRLRGVRAGARGESEGCGGRGRGRGDGGDDGGEWREGW